MKLDPSIIALKDFDGINVIRLKLARYSTANKAPSINASEWDLEPQIIYNMTYNVLRCYKFIHNMYVKMINVCQND